MRGFTLDNRFNYRRDGLPINAETVIAAGQQAAHRDPQGHQRPAGRHQRAGRPGQPGRQAPGRRRAAQRHAGLATRTAALSAAVDLGAALRRRRPSAGASTPPHDTWTRAPATADGSATCWRWPSTGALAAGTPARSRIRDGAARASPARRASACWAAACPMPAHRPAHQPEQPALVAAGGVGRPTPPRCATRRR